jgi:hypothetical protein
MAAGLVVSSLLAGPGSQASDTPVAKPHPRVRARLPESAQQYYRLLWGVDRLEAKPVSSGAMIRFSYRVVDAVKAKTINDKEAIPQMIDQRTHASLVIPEMEKIGKLRQTSTPEAGREYWMLFSNKGSLVHAGSRVDVRIGNFRAEGLIVRSD